MKNIRKFWWGFETSIQRIGFILVLVIGCIEGSAMFLPTNSTVMSILIMLCALLIPIGLILVDKYYSTFPPEDPSFIEWNNKPGKAGYITAIIIQITIIVGKGVLMIQGAEYLFQQGLTGDGFFNMMDLDREFYGAIMLIAATITEIWFVIRVHNRELKNLRLSAFKGEEFIEKVEERA